MDIATTQEDSLTQAQDGNWEVSNHEYHATKSYLGNTALNLLVEDPYLFHLWEQGKYEKPSTKALRLGSGTDAILSGTFPEECVVQPKVNGRTKAGKGDKALFGLQNRHKTILSQAEYDTCRRMADAVLADSDAMSLLGSPGKWQQSYRWTTKGHGLKVRFDYLLDSGEEAQLKTRRRPKKGRTPLEQWQRDMWEFAYYRGAALYTHARKLMGLAGPHYFVTVYNEPPHSVFVYETDKSWLDLGRLHLKQILKELKRRREQSDWLPKGGGKITLCGAPEWTANYLELDI